MSEFENSIFSGSLALGSMDTIEEETTPEAFAMERHCEWCGAERRVEIPWAELCAVAMNQFPQHINPGFSTWKYSPQHAKMFPDIRCSCHPNALLFFPMTPGRARQLIENAVAANVVSPHQKAMMDQIKARIRQMAHQPR